MAIRPAETGRHHRALEPAIGTNRIAILTPRGHLPRDPSRSRFAGISGDPVPLHHARWTAFHQRYIWASSSASVPSRVTCSGISTRAIRRSVAAARFSPESAGIR